MLIVWRRRKKFTDALNSHDAGTISKANRVNYGNNKKNTV
jgi:hypothetical protein